MKKQKDNKIVLSITIGVILFYIIIISFSNVPAPAAPIALPISNEGFVKVDVSLEGSALQFSSECFTVIMNIHEIQALSIRNGMANRIDTRPLTHDMLREIIDNFGIKVLQVSVESFEDDIYKAKTFLQQGSKLLDIDTRPSDAVGIAVRTGAPVYFNKQLLESKGVNTCK